MYKKFVFICLLHLFYVQCDDNCDKLGTLIYEDLGCIPKIPEAKICPSKFECEDFAKSQETCLFQGRKIPVGKSINDSLVYGACNVGCRCIFNEDKKETEFICAVLDCPEWLGAPLQSPLCYRTYSLGKCCSTGSKCPPFDNKVKCIVDGEEYKEGEKFYPKNKCVQCICQEGFSGKFEDPYCRRITCAQQIRISDKLVKNCAPVYFGEEILCCPDTWICPSKDDKIKQINPVSNKQDSDLTCKWGERVVKLGEGLETKTEYFNEVKNVTCECILPPFLTCKETGK